MEAEKQHVALSEQQRMLREGSASPLSAYRALVFGESSWIKFIGFELYQLIVSGMAGAAGLFLRQKLLPLFLAGAGGKLICGRWVTIRNPGRVTLGAHVLLDDSSVIDIRAKGESKGSTRARVVLGDSVVVGRNSLLVSKEGEIVCRDGVNISSFCRIATQSRVEIGESTLIAAYSYIGPGNHRLDEAAKPVIERGMEILGGVTIGRNVWVGAHTTILDGVTIGDGAVIGAHSLVRESVPPHTLAAGVPARVIRELSPGDEALHGEKRSLLLG